MAGPTLKLEVSLGSSWSEDSPRMEAPGFPDTVGPGIRKNVYDKYFLCPKNIALCTKIFFKTMDHLTLIEAVHFFAFISIGALPRGTAPRHSAYLLMLLMAFVVLLDAARAAMTLSPAAVAVVAALTLPPAP